MTLRRRYLMDGQDFLPFDGSGTHPHFTDNGKMQAETTHANETSLTWRTVPGLTPGPVNLSCSCLLVPVVFAVWWYWFKRKTKKVITRLLHSESDTTESEREETASDFSSWEEVSENNAGDASVHFVRWIKTHPNTTSTTRQRASIVQNSKRTLRLASSPRSVLDGLTESILDDEISTSSSVETDSKWQGLEETDVGCMEAPSACSGSYHQTVVVQASVDETGYCGGTIA